MHNVQGETWRERWVDGVAVFLLLAVFAVGMVVRGAGPMAIETGWLRAVQATHTTVLDSGALAIDWLFSPSVGGFVVLLIAAACFLFTRDIRLVLKFTTLAVLGWLGSEFLKFVVQRPRPDLTGTLIANPLSASYPSGHTAFAACLMLALIVITRGRARTVLAIVGGLVALATAYSRVYLGVHYVSDVLASLVYSVAAIALLNLVWDRIVTSRFETRRLADG